MTLKILDTLIDLNVIYGFVYAFGVQFPQLLAQSS